jgi:thiamine biosynthesis lipoprotein
MRIPRPAWRLTLVLIVATTARASSSELVRFERSERHMGTQFTITLFAKHKDTAEIAFRSAFERIAQLDQKMSDYLPDSEVSRLNAKSREAVASAVVSQDLWRVLTRGQQISQLTDGAFDMTLGPLTRLWRRARRTRELPDAQRLAAAREAAGFRQLNLDAQQRAVQLRARMRLDLGGIAKGDALDQAMAALKQSGVSCALINGGGDLLASHAPPGRRGWRVGLIGLDADAEVEDTIWLSRSAVATSGDLWQYVPIDGIRYSHLIDPETGLGLTRRSTVSVLAPRAIDADAFASAVSVMGPVKGIQLLLMQPDLEGRIVHKRDGKVAVMMTPGFERIKCAAEQSVEN